MPETNVIPFRPRDPNTALTEQRPVFQENAERAAAPEAQVVEDVADNAALIEEPGRPGMFARMRGWFGRRIRAVINLPKYGIREVPEVIENTYKAGGGVVTWAGGNIKEAWDVGVSLAATPFNAALEAGRLGYDPVRGIALDVRDKVRNVFADKDYTLANMFWRFPKNVALAAVSPVTGMGKGIKNYFAGRDDGDGNLLERWQGVAMDKGRGGIKNIWKETRELLDQTARKGPVQFLRTEAQAFEEISDSVRTVVGRVIDIGSERMADAIIPRGRELNKLLRDQQALIANDNASMLPASAPAEERARAA